MYCSSCVSLPALMALHESLGANFGDGSRFLTSSFFVIGIPESSIVMVELVLSGMILMKTFGWALTCSGSV